MPRPTYGRNMPISATAALAATSLGIEDDLKCGTCLELFQDPRSLPCLHTFCLECIKRTINGSNTFKCPLCRAVHKLSEEKAELLPVDQYAVQELPLRRLQQSEATTYHAKVPDLWRTDINSSLVCLRTAAAASFANRV